MKLYPTILTVACLATAAAAQQAPVNLETATDFGVFAKSGNNARLHFVKKGTKLTKPLMLSTRADAAFASVSARAGSDGHGRALASIGERGGAALQRSGSASAGSTASSDPKNIRPGPHALLLRVGIKQNTKARVAVSYFGVAGPHSKASAGVDVNGDGKDDFTAAADGKRHSKTFDLTATAQGIVVRMRSEANATLTAAGRAFYSGELTVAVTGPGDQRCTFTRFGPSCGPVLGAVERKTKNGDAIAFITHRAHPSSAGLFLLGTRRASARIPGTRCFLNTIPLVILPNRTDPRGSATVVIPLPKAFAGTVIGQQAVLFSNQRQLGIQTSNGLAAACKKGV